LQASVFSIVSHKHTSLLQYLYIMRQGYFNGTGPRGQYNVTFYGRKCCGIIVS